MNFATSASAALISVLRGALSSARLLAEMRRCSALASRLSRSAVAVSFLLLAAGQHELAVIVEVAVVGSHAAVGDKP